MMTHRFALASTLPAVVTIAALLAGAEACSSSNSDDAGSSGAACFATNGLDAVKISKADACARYVAAVLKAADRLKCSFEVTPSCPETLDQFEADTIKSHPGFCPDGFSAGTVANCECRVAAYTSCADFSGSKQCVLGILQAPPGTTCTTDAGTDAGGDDTFDTSPLDDAPAADAADAGGGG